MSIIVEVIDQPLVQYCTRERHEHDDTNITANSSPGIPKQLATNNDHSSDHQNCALGISNTIIGKYARHTIVGKT